ncbi:MAG: SDR family NAD(P)-dependent oxidoreductase [Planctomycetota bacterium]|nr:MAG: SDR family NAD(P)-dependent oxidoreductase [Planctomycetota bacterium]
MLPPDTFRGTTILVTGGGTGLGRAMGQYLLSLGANLAVCGRRREVVEQAAAEMAEASGGQTLALPCDVREPEQVEAMLAAVRERFGRLDALVNNAAGNFVCPTERLSYNAFNAVVDIVLKGTYNCTLAVGKQWIEEKTPGTVLNISTTYAWTGSGYVVPSAVSKAGALVMVRSLASEWGKYGIRINAIAPGSFPTEGAWSRLRPEELGDDDKLDRIPLHRYGEHQELANLAAYLLSDFSAYITGACITIDGGAWLRGAGMFNELERVSSEQWDAVQAAVKKRREG